MVEPGGDQEGGEQGGSEYNAAVGNMNKETSGRNGSVAENH